MEEIGGLDGRGVEGGLDRGEGWMGEGWRVDGRGVEGGWERGGGLKLEAGSVGGPSLTELWCMLEECGVGKGSW